MFFFFTCSCNSSNCAGDHSRAEVLSFARTKENSDKSTCPSEKICYKVKTRIILYDDINKLTDYIQINLFNVFPSSLALAKLCLFLEQIMPADKYPSIYSCKMEAPCSVDLHTVSNKHIQECQSCHLWHSLKKHQGSQVNKTNVRVLR